MIPPLRLLLGSRRVPGLLVAAVVLALLGASLPPVQEAATGPPGTAIGGGGVEDLGASRGVVQPLVGVPTGPAPTVAPVEWMSPPGVETVPRPATGRMGREWPVRVEQGRRPVVFGAAGIERCRLMCVFRL